MTLMLKNGKSYSDASESILAYKSDKDFLKFTKKAQNKLEKNSQKDAENEKLFKDFYEQYCNPNSSFKFNDRYKLQRE
jgi:hypothetical protein